MLHSAFAREFPRQVFGCAKDVAVEVTRPPQQKRVQQQVVAAMKEITKKLRDVIAIELQVGTFYFNQPLMEAPAEKQLQVPAWKLEVHTPGAALHFLQK